VNHSFHIGTHSSPSKKAHGEKEKVVLAYRKSAGAGGK